MKVRDVMSTHVVSVGQDEPVSAAARLLRRCDVGALPVSDSTGRLRGVVTDRDIVLRCVALDGDPERIRVREIMSRGVVTAGAGEELASAAGRMAQRQLHRLPVTEEGRVIGMLSLADLARESRCAMEAGAALGRISENIRRL